MLVIRGTSSLKEVLTDLAGHMVDFALGGHTHNGMLQVSHFMQLWGGPGAADVSAVTMPGADELLTSRDREHGSMVLPLYGFLSEC